MKVVIIDSGVSNLTSVIAAFDRLGIDVDISNDAEVIKLATHVVLPGVGSAPVAMKSIRKQRLEFVIRDLTQPVFGICLGMQIMFDRSNENGGCDCLGIINGSVNRLIEKPGMPVPHMGWNQLDITDDSNPLLYGIENGAFVYFVHSYAALVNSATIATCGYAETFCAIVQKRNFFGCQFHPERSGSVGAKILKNFIRI